MTCRTWENRCKRSSAASPGKVRIEGGNEAKRSTVELRSLAVGFCGRIKGCPEFMRSKGRPSILRSAEFRTFSRVTVEEAVAHAETAQEETSAEASPSASRPRTIQSCCPEQPYLKKRPAYL